MEKNNIPVCKLLGVEPNQQFVFHEKVLLVDMEGKIKHLDGLVPSTELIFNLLYLYSWKAK